MRSTVLRRAVLLSLVLALAVPPAAPPGAHVAQAQGTRDALEQLLPPGARQLLAAVRVFKAHSTRNRVYRQAHRVQRQLRAYYDARIKTAEQYVRDRERLGLSKSQVAAYGRVALALKVEKQAAIDLTEDEKRAAHLAIGPG